MTVAAAGLPARVFVAGHRGMLGHVVRREFEDQGVEVVTTDARYNAEARDPVVEAARESGAPYVINCLGRIKQKSADPGDLYRANTLFPLHLRERLRAGQFLIHASTDCVFAGSRGNYAIDDERDADDVYGVSKALGEGVALHPETLVIRASIVGPERPRAPGEPGSGLLGWFLSQPEETPLRGFTNHRWNGITTLDWAHVAAECMARREGGARLPAIVQPGTGAVSKYELLELFRTAFGTSHRIDPFEAPDPVDRTLRPTLERRPLPDQLSELSAWCAVDARCASC